MARPESWFMRTNVPLLLQRYSLFFCRECSCIEYFVSERASHETISSSIVFSYSPSKADLHVSRFYPELYLQPTCKYMSATCFYLLIHHFADFFSLDDSDHISLETVPVIRDGFYKKLRDFDFHTHKACLGNVVELFSDVIRRPVDTSMVMEYVFRSDEIPFLK